MKRLKIINHLGEVVIEFDVYLDGQSVDWRSPKLEAVWLSRITIQDPDEPVEEEASPVSEEVKEPEVEHITEIPPQLEELEQGLNQEGLTLKSLPVERDAEATELVCELCGWAGTQRECTFGHDDFVCPKCQRESLKEVTNEPKTTGDKSLRKRRAGKADSSKDSKKLPKKSARGQATKRSK